MDKLLKEIATKLQLLEFKQNKTKDIVEKGNTATIERYREALVALAKEVDVVKGKIEEKKLEGGESMDEVCTWSSEIDAKIEGVDAEIDYLGRHLREKRQQSELAEKEGEEALLEKEREKQLKFEKEKLEMKLKYEEKSAELRNGKQGESSGSHAKLPKLSITKYDGTYEQWLPFWNKFCAEIESTNLAPVTKFAYLKELLQPQVRADIDGLPFSTEGYERAKNILQSEYGKTSEIVNAYVNNIMGLPTIMGENPRDVEEFYKRLLYNVQSLETLGKLRDVAGNVRAVLDKLKGIKSDLVRGHERWQEWDFRQLLKAIKRWKDINPVTDASQSEIQRSEPTYSPKEKNVKNDGFLRRRSYQTRQDIGRQMYGCVYCDKTGHFSANCPKVVSVGDRKKILSQKQLCFNCTGDRHRAESCRSRGCHNCQRKHHTSICDQTNNANVGRFLTAQDKGSGKVIYPVVVVEVNGIKCRALLDTGAGSSYASSAILDHLRIRPLREEFKRIEMMLGSVNKAIGVYGVTIDSLDGNFRLETEVTKVDRGSLLSLENPKYSEAIQKYPHLTGIQMTDRDDKPELPVHIILGVSDYAKIRTETRPKIGSPGEPVAELTKFGWTIMSPGKEADISSMLLTQTAAADYEQLCKLDVLGIQDTAIGDQTDVYEEFKEQLTRSAEGWYETGLPWKGNHPTLPNNKAGSLKRLENTVRKLENQGLLEQYDAIIKEQLVEGIVEPAEEQFVGREFYIPHKPVIRESAESTKLRIVYDASARAYDKAPSLNDCLHAGPPLQNQLWSVMVRARFHPVLTTGDMKQAFLQVRIRMQDRDAMRFHWIADLKTRRVEALRFTRALFGLSSSPFLLGGVIKQHLENCRKAHPEIVNEIEKSLYVDDLINGGPTVEAAKQVKETSTEVFAQGGFTLHKWHSNATELDAMSANQVSETQETYAKQQLGAPQRGKGALLGVPWDKEKDTIEVKFPGERVQPTKRNLLTKLAKVYDPLGFASPTTLSGKLLYRKACELKIAWDAELPKELGKKNEGKAYIVLYACSLTRGIYLELLPNMETTEFITSFIAHRGRPEKIYSDNGKTFVGAANVLKTIMHDEKVHDYLAKHRIMWQFNLSRAPWWGGQFERLIGLVKRALYKSIGGGLLTWAELQDVLLDVEVTLNNRPLSYVEDDPQLPVLTPNSLLFGQPNLLPELEHHHLESPDLRRRAKYLKRCKDAMWRRWTDDYLRGLREQHRLKHPGSQSDIAVGDVMLVKDDERNRGKWKMGIVVEVITGRDGIARAARMKTGTGSYLERALQQLYPLELSCDREPQGAQNVLSVNAAEFPPRRETRQAARDALRRIAAFASDENN
ncbi:uncharacterized protein LOC141887949 [Acropora palmata]|uniref:uncharacterized protein LOC141887949 n=1 Tax=Acropora palmata TaxID=6131 RepID=UPI003DA1C8B9